MGITSTCVFLSIGYFLGYALHLRVVWFIFFVMSVYALADKFFLPPERNPRYRRFRQSNATSPTRILAVANSFQTRGIANSWASLFPAVGLSPSESAESDDLMRNDGASTDSNLSSRQNNGDLHASSVHWLNVIIDGVWNHPFEFAQPHRLIKFLNDWIRDAKLLSSLLENIQVLDLDLGSIPPRVESARVLQHSFTQTVIETNIKFDGNAFGKCVVQPRVVPINLHCSLSHVLICAKLRFIIKYEDDFISEICVSLSEYPSTLTGAVQLFESLDCNSLSYALPSLTENIRKKLRQVVSHFEYPRSLSLWTPQNGIRLRLNQRTSFVSPHLQKEELDELEDEIRSNLLQIDRLLNSAKKSAINDSAKTEIANSLLQFLQSSSQPGRVPVSMMETVKRSYDLLNGLVFGNSSNTSNNNSNSTPPTANKNVLDVILQRDTLSFLASIVRKCPGLADRLFLNMLQVDEPDLRAHINAALIESELQDIPFVVVNRSSR